MKLSQQAEDCRHDGPIGMNCGYFVFRRGNATLRVIASDGEGWDHVSVSLATRCPTWDEMCFVKRQFFGPEETVIQFHPAVEAYVNCHPFCLHLWRPQEVEIQLPPTVLIGPLDGGCV